MSEQKQCFSEMSCGLKMACILAVISLVVSTIALMRTCCGGKNDKKSTAKEIAAWVKKNPEAIIDSVNTHVRKQQEEYNKKQQEDAKASLKKYKDKINDAKNCGIINPNGKKVIIEFFDYNCSYCRLAAKALAELTAEDKDVKVIAKELPILSEISVTAAQYSTAVAMAAPKKYGDFNKHLFESGARNKESIIKALKDSGIDVQLIEKTLSSEKAEIEKRLEANRELAGLLHLSGTPAFIIGEEFIPGYIEKQAMIELLNKK